MVTLTHPFRAKSPSLISGIVRQVHGLSHARILIAGKLPVSILFCLTVVSWLGVAAAQAQQPSRLETIIQRGTLRVGTTGDYPPFSARDLATSAVRGFDVDMVEAMAKALGVKIEIVRTAWPQLSGDFAADRFDVAVGGISITPERESKGLFSTPVMQEGKTPIARCTDLGKFETLVDIDRAGTVVIVNSGGTNERFARANIKKAEIRVHADNLTIFDEIAKGNADLMITDASETRYQQKLHPGVLCAIHPDQPFDHAQKAYWLQRDAALKAFVDGWIKNAVEDGSFAKIYAAWFE